jgi:hypothetical protein
MEYILINFSIFKINERILKYNIIYIININQFLYFYFNYNCCFILVFSSYCRIFICSSYPIVLKLVYVIEVKLIK